MHSPPTDTDADRELDLAADDVVHVKTTMNGNRSVFHVAADCEFCPDNSRTWDAETAVAWGLAPCTYCSDTEADAAGEPEDTVEQDHSLHEALVEIGETRAARRESDEPVWKRQPTNASSADD